MTDERARALGVWAGVVGPLAFGGAALIGATQVAGYSPRLNMVSELAAKGSDARGTMTAGFLVYGVALVVLAVCLRRVWPSVMALAVIVGLSGIGTLAAGAGSCDPGCPTSGAQSFSQQVHSAASVPTFLLWLAATLVAAWRFRDSWYGKIAAVLAVVQLIGMIALGSMNGSGNGGDSPDGTAQRVALIASGAWVWATAAALRSDVSPTPRDRTA